MNEIMLKKNGMVMLLAVSIERILCGNREAQPIVNSGSLY